MGGVGFAKAEPGVAEAGVSPVGLLLLGGSEISSAGPRLRVR